MKTKIVLPILLLIAIFIGVGLWLAAQPAKNQLEGMIDTNEIQVAARASGRLHSLLAKEGDLVEKGQALFVLSNKELEAQLAAAKAALQGAQAQLEKADNGLQREDVASAKSAWLAQQAGAEQAALTARRMNNLFHEGVISEQKRDEANASAKVANSAEASARSQYAKAVNGTRQEDKKIINAQLAQATEAEKSMTSLEEELRTPAPAQGQITQRFANEGEVVTAGFPIFSMIRPDDFWVSFNLKENQFSALSMGQEIVGEIPALNNKKLKFTVYFINPQGDFATWRATRQSEGYDIKAFEVRARPAEQLPQLRPGMTVLFDWPPSPTR